MASVSRKSNDRWAQDIAAVLPAQGDWSETEYLWLTERSSRLIEFDHGQIEVLPVPTDRHQTILLFLYAVVLSWTKPRNGMLLAPMRLRLMDERYREPDLLLLRNTDDPRRQNAYWEGADFVLEVVSPDDRGRDLVGKRAEYATAGIPEYWIVDPEHETIAVLRLDGDTYVEDGVYRRGDTASSPSLEGLSVDVAAVFDAQ